MNGRPAMLRSCASASGSTGTPLIQALIGAPFVSMYLKLLMGFALLPGRSAAAKMKAPPRTSDPGGATLADKDGRLCHRHGVLSGRGRRKFGQAQWPAIAAAAIPSAM